MTTANMRTGSGGKGFTLIELIVVLAAVLVLSGVATAFGPKIVARQQLQQAATSVMQDLRRAQAEAMFKRTTRQVSFTTGAGSAYQYQVGGTASSPVMFPVIRLRGGTQIQSAIFGSTPGTVVFDSFGVPSPGGGEVVLVNSGGSIGVTVSPVTGTIGMVWR